MLRAHPYLRVPSQFAVRFSPHYYSRKVFGTDDSWRPSRPSSRVPRQRDGDPARSSGRNLLASSPSGRISVMLLEGAASTRGDRYAGPWRPRPARGRGSEGRPAPLDSPRAPRHSHRSGSADTGAENQEGFHMRNIFRVNAELPAALRRYTCPVPPLASPDRATRHPGRPIPWKRSWRRRVPVSPPRSRPRWGSPSAADLAASAIQSPQGTGPP